MDGQLEQNLWVVCVQKVNERGLGDLSKQIDFLFGNGNQIHLCLDFCCGE